MIVVDTTVLVYAKGADHPLREPCRALLEAVARGVITGTTTAEVIQEFAHVRARRRHRSDAAELASAYLDLLSPLLPVGEEQVREGLRLFELHPRLGCFDAVLAAAAVAAEAEALVSADGAFGSVPGLVHIDPGSPELWSLLGR